MFYVFYLFLPSPIFLQLCEMESLSCSSQQNRIDTSKGCTILQVKQHKRTSRDVKSGNVKHLIKFLFVLFAKGIASRFCRTMTEIKLNLIPYFPRIKEMDRVGFEPTT